eukprot:TRINITY_DN36747_c0_g1_i1.p1 TRINITY_DN36747_c0_g1~~TRINITY_DN36747_c0_g1_i1.p1  ORF type:complete len:220 (-),score=19.39 TRINITY_DN36747_c0_g1_i1:114-737(-)
MLKHLIFVTLLSMVCCQKKGNFRLFKANFKQCEGSEAGLLKINGIGISAPLAKKQNCFNRHLLVKGRRVQICVNGTLPEQLPFPTPIQGGAGLKNSAHGTLPALPPQDFCDIAKDSCQASNPSCDQMQPGQTIELCSVMKVPNDPITLNPLIQPNVLVRWRIFYDPQFDSSVCEKNFNLRGGQVPLVCIDMDTKVVNKPSCPGGLGK